MAAIAGYMDSLASLQNRLKDASGYSLELLDDDEEAGEVNHADRLVAKAKAKAKGKRNLKKGATAGWHA